MPSYLGPEQLTPVAPAIANGQAILNTFGAEQQYWAMGAAQLKNAYSSYLGMDVSNPGNQSRLGDLMQGTKQSISRAAQTNLAVGDNVTKALGVFDPILKDKDIMGDYALTSRIKGELSKADSYRLKDGGKEYNEASVRKLQAGLQLYASDPNKSNWSQYLALDDKYTPYYDKTAELKQLQDMFKTDVIKTSNTPHPGYIIDRKDSSWVQSKWQQFVEANASQKLKDQLKTESDADYRQNLLMNRNSPNVVYNHYAQKLDNMRLEKLDDSNQTLNRATSELRGLSKNDPLYDKKKAQYDAIIVAANRDVKNLLNPKNMENYLPKTIIDYNNVGAGQEYANSLYQHEYFGKIGKSFAHLEVDETVRQDTAYFASLNLNARYAEMRQDASQFNSTMMFNEKKLSQEERLFNVKADLDLAIAGMKRDAKGNTVHMGDGVYETTDVENSGKHGEELGAEITTQFNNAVGNGAANLYDAAASGYLGNDVFINAINAGGNTPLNQLTTNGVTSETRNKLTKFMADAMWGSKAYSASGITDIDPEVAKRKYAQMLDNAPAYLVKKGLNQIMGNPRIMESVLSNLTDKTGGYKLKADIEHANNDLKASIQSYNERYGPAIVGALKESGLKAYYSPDSPEYKAGIRGYEQQIGAPSFSMMTDDQIKVMVEGMAQRGELSSKYGSRMSPVIIAPGVNTANFKYPTGKLDVAVDDIKKKINLAIGKVGEVSAVGQAETFTVNPKNKGQAFTFVNSVLSTLTGANDDKARTFAGLIKRNPDAVLSYTTYGNGLTGNATVGIAIDQSKLTEDERKELPANYQDIRLATTSQQIDPRFRTNDPAYLALVKRPKVTNYDFRMPGTVNGGQAQISISNTNDENSPKFQLEASYYVPDFEKNGVIKYDDKGNLMLRRVTPSEVNFAIDRELKESTGIGLEESLAKNPSQIYRQTQYHATKWREYINQIQMRRANKLSDLPADIVAELEKIQP